MTDHDARVPSPWFTAHAARVQAGAALGPVVDLASGRGRHALAAAELGACTVAMDRDGLAIRLFGLKENEIDSKLMKVKWNDRALSRSVDDLALADALLPMIRQLLRDAREESDE